MKKWRRDKFAVRKTTTVNSECNGGSHFIGKNVPHLILELYPFAEPTQSFLLLPGERYIARQQKYKQSLTYNQNNVH